MVILHELHIKSPLFLTNSQYFQLITHLSTISSQFLRYPPLISSYFPVFSHCFPISFPYAAIFPICFYICPIFYHRKVPYASIKFQFLVVSPCFTRHFFHMAKPVLFISVPGSWVRISADHGIFCTTISWYSWEILCWYCTIVIVGKY